MNNDSLVCDTSVLLYLGRIGKADLLSLLYRQIYVPGQVATELDAGRMLRQDTIDPRLKGWATVVSVSQEEMNSLPENRLGIGERAVIAYAANHAGCLAGLDDRTARLFAESLGVKVIGMIGILLKAKQKGLTASISSLLQDARNQGFRISAEVYQEAVRLAGEKI
jgi:predicted nucleic acid-binding protein